MKKSLILCACTIVSLCFVSCLRDHLQKPDINSTGFGIMVGGNIDPAQTFNLAEQHNVTVSVPSESTVRIYTNDGHGNKLVAVKKVNGTQKVYFDAPHKAEKVTVMNMNGGRFETVAIGGSADFTQPASAGTRSVLAGDNIVSAQADNEYKQFDYSVVSQDVTTDAFYSLDNAAHLFYSKSGSFTLNPCWYTQESGEKGTLGIYYFDQDGNRVEKQIFVNDKKGDWYQLWSTNKGGYFRSYSDAHMSSLATYGDFDKVQYRSKGIQVTVPANTAFGFFISGMDVPDVRYYSEEIEYGFPRTADRAWVRNNLDNWIKWGNNSAYINGTREFFGHMALIDVEGRKYLGCDDGCEIINGRGEKDLRPHYYNMVFSISGDLSDQICEPESESQSEPEDPNKGKLSPDTLSWILACEDLGESADYDFNDVVLKITYVAGAEKATVSLLAAGGTLKSNLWFGDRNLGEVHDLFGVADTIMVNTWQQLDARPSVALEIDVPENFAMSAENMGGFLIKRNGISGVVAAPEPGMVPYMICIPGTWKWPREMKKITDAYPSFAGWVQDHTTNLDWYSNPVESLVFSK